MRSNMKVYRSVKGLLKLLYYVVALFLVLSTAMVLVKQNVKVQQVLEFEDSQRILYARGVIGEIDSERHQGRIEESNEQKEKLLNDSKINSRDDDELNMSYWDNEISNKIFNEEMPNPHLVFHNKLPKSGSSTMNNILKVVSKQLGFGFDKVETGTRGFTTTFNSESVVDYVKQIKQEKFLLLKHHQFFDFTEYGLPQPTFINVMRDPLEWFTSRYYFARNGWSRKPGCRECKGMSKDEVEMTIDECVEKRHIQCTEPWFYIQFFCGSSTKCTNLTTTENKQWATEEAKYNILHNYHIVGILEQFEDTLNVFDRLIPSYFKNATNAWKSGFVQGQQAKTKTINKKEMSEESKEYFRNGPLYYEMELYEFARKLFNERMRRLNIEPAVLED